MKNMPFLRGMMVLVLLHLCIPMVAEATNKDSAIYYQHKGMYLFKARKYEVGLAYLDSAVGCDKSYIDYRAFMKCIFQKTYVSAIADFNSALALKGNGYIMDHPYYFYLALCYLQLNKFDSANLYMSKCITEERTQRSDASIHYLHYFYYGLVKCELKQYDEAVSYMDSCLTVFAHMPDAQYYKALCLNHSGRKAEALALLKDAEQNMKLGYTINEDNAIYERYPYQVSTHQLEYALKSFDAK